MSEQPQSSTLPADGVPSGGYDRRSWRRQRLAARRAARAYRRGTSWIGGAILITTGILVLLHYQVGLSVERWWALFILIPAVAAFGSAWLTYQHGRRWSAAARGSLIMGVLLTLVAATFLVNLDWVIAGPVLLILAGGAFLINTILPGG